MRVAEISLPAIRHNVRHIRELTGGQVIAVIKANGYGHGAALAARAAIEGGAALLGVADLEEALLLRDAGVDAPLICWLHGARADFDAAIAHKIEIGVNHLEQLEALAEAARRANSRATLQLKIDTGLSRNGAAPEEWNELFARAAELEREGIVWVRGIFSHLANAGSDEDLAQATRFDDAVARLHAAGCAPEMIHLAASAATFTSPHLRYNTVRVGMAIYGLSPLADQTSADLGLIPAMTLCSEIVALRQVTAGTGVSYGFNHVAQSDTTLGLVPIGYADGMPRALNGAGATVAVAGQHCPIVGRIGMDQCIVDLGKLGKRVNIGDRVVLFGDPAMGVPPVEMWAELMRTINYEIIASIGNRVVRVPTDEVAHHGADFDAPHGAAPDTGTSRVLQIEDPEAMHHLGVQLGRSFSAGDLVILTGPLGAGKTTLSRGIGEGLGVRGPVTSPTFVLARTHPSLVGGAPLVHVDAYRLAGAAELDDLDLDFDGSVVVAEWGAGLIEARGSWIEIVIERPIGGIVTGGGGSGSRSGSVNGDASGALGGDVDDRHDGALNDDGDGDDDDELIEPRTVTITGYGPRYENGVI